jgi:competence protein ComFC
MVSVHPQKIKGSWKQGWALDLHSERSFYIGQSRYDTKRTDLGELLYRLKYQSEQDALPPLVDIASSFIATWKPDVSLIVPVPPTATRAVQPVRLLADGVAAKLKLPIAHDAIEKHERFQELKNVYDVQQRRNLLDGAFVVNAERVRAERILLIDDLYRSGATMNAIAEALSKAGAAVVYAFALTKTRKNA